MVQGQLFKDHFKAVYLRVEEILQRDQSPVLEDNNIYPSLSLQCYLQINNLG